MADQDHRASLPALHEAWLDEEQLLDLFSDLELVATVIEIRTKSSSGAHSNAISRSLVGLAAKLWANEVPAVQVVYLYQGQAWLDTLMRNARGVRVVRLRREAAGPNG